MPKQSAMSALARFTLSLALLASLPMTVRAAPRAPALDPPTAQQTTPAASFVPRAASASDDPLVEWTFHKSPGGAHPDGDEQCFLWLMNRARQDPMGEGYFLANVEDASVQSAIGWFQVNLGVLQDEFAVLEAKPPAAFDARLYAAAYDHSLYLIGADAQNHTGQFDRVASAGFHAFSMRGNVFSYAESALYGHAGFNIDWGGSDGTGMQAGRGHRLAIMSVDGDYTNVGLAAVPEANPATSVGPLVVTGNYAYADPSQVDQYNRFLVGTVWEDLDHDGRYDPGEGIGGVDVVPSAGSYFAVTGAGGGYAIPLPVTVAEGSIAVNFSGGSVAPRTVMTDVGADSTLVDYLVPEPNAAMAGVFALFALVTLRQQRNQRR